MKIQSKIFLYNFLTVTFAVLAMVSIGSLGQLPLFTVVSNVAVFSALTYFCADRENHFRSVLKARRKAKKVQLSVYKSAVPSKAA